MKGQIEITSYLKGGYVNNRPAGSEKNKAKQTQFIRAEFRVLRAAKTNLKKQSQITPKGVEKSYIRWLKPEIRWFLLKFLQYTDFPAYVIMEASKERKISNESRKQKMKMASNLRIKRLIPLLLIVFILCSFAHSKTIYVDDDAVGNNDGTNWENAYTFLQDALYDAEISEKPVEIRVAQGVYKPNQRMLQPLGDEDNTFSLVNEVTVKGGYTGFGEIDPNSRDIEICETILSGDLNGDDIIVEDPCDMLLVQSNRGDNSSVVVRANYTDETTVLDGFVITGGFFKNTYTGPSNGGAGMHIYKGSPTIRNCTFTGNAANQIGGGLLNRGGSNPMLINCAFIGNYAESGGGIYNTPNMPAPGMISEGSHPTLVNCTFDNNCALKNGGGIYNFLSDPTLTDCTFRRNQVIGPYSGSTRGSYTGGGGGMYNSNSNPVLTNCQFSENSAGDGGGICNIADSNVTLTNCTFKNNSASAIGGGLSNLKNCKLTLTNCEFINNSVTGIGGGLANDSGNAMLVKCVFSGNQAYDWSMHSTSQVFSGLGGGMSAGSNSTLINCKFQLNYATEGAGMYLGGSPELIGCIFIDNSAIEDGGGIQNVGTSSEPVITNCIFSGNSANRGGGIFFTWGARMIMANCTFAGNSASIGKTLASEPTKPSLPGYINLINCILWDGDNAIFDPEPYALRSAIIYSNIQGGWPGEGNIDSDPCFTDPGYWSDADDPNIAVDPNDSNTVWIDGDYHLKSQAGRWDTNSQSWVIDDITSPCIDASDPNSPVAFEPFPNGGIINMGAYGGTAEASKSPSGLHAKYGGGVGESNNPYLIYTAEQMNTIGLHEQDWDKHFKLIADINLTGFSGTDFNIIGNNTVPFSGFFDGKGYRVLNFTYRSTEKESIGLFGYIRTGLGCHIAVQNLGLVDPNVKAGNARGVGALVGQLFNGIISRCYVEGGRVSGDSNIGGLVGWTSATNMGGLERSVVNCYTSCQVSGNSNVGGIIGLISPQACVLDCQSFGTITGEECVGGIIGSSMYTEISHCYTTAQVIGKNKTGGIVGMCQGSNYVITACAAFGSVDGESDTGGLVGWNIYAGITDSYSVAHVSGICRVGGLVGSNQGTVSNCYAAGLVKGQSQTGGLIGSPDEDPFYPVGSVCDSLWDIETSGQTTSAGGMGKTKAEMQTTNTFLEAGWDFVDESANGTEDIWWILEGQDYPKLWWENEQI